MLLTWLLVVWFALSLLVIAALWLIGWAYKLGEKAGRKAHHDEVMRRMLSPEFAVSLAKELGPILEREQARENQMRYGSSTGMH